MPLAFTQEDFLVYFMFFLLNKAFIGENVCRDLRNTYLIQVLCLILDLPDSSSGPFGVCMF